MGTYYSVHGFLKFTNPEKFNEAKRILTNGGWFKEDGFVEDIDYDKKCFFNLPKSIAFLKSKEDEVVYGIYLPFGSYRNLGRVTQELMHLANESAIVMTTTDGDEWGGAYKNGQAIIEAQLDEWGRTNSEDDEPQEENCDNEDEYFDERMTWINEVENQFLSYYEDELNINPQIFNQEE